MNTLKQKRTRRLLVFIPIICLPFLCLLFWTLRAQSTAATQHDPAEHLNMNLPEPQFDEPSETGKMFFYEQAFEDSLRFAEQARSDPYFDSKVIPDSGSSMLLPDAVNDIDLQVLNDRLAQAYGQSTIAAYQPTPPHGLPSLPDYSLPYTGAASADPEMVQLDEMLEKILDIRDPTRARERLRQRSMQNSKLVYTVVPKVKTTEDDLIITGRASRSSFKDRAPNRFLGTPEIDASPEDQQPAVSAAVYKTVTVVSGSAIQLCLSSDILINGAFIARGSFIYGICQLNGDRLQINVQSIRHNNNLFPVNLDAYDLDGIAGIYIPGAIGRDVSKDAAHDAIQDMDYMPVEHSLTTQAASAGISAIKTLLSKKAKLVKVTVRAGYQLLLKDANTPD